MNQQVICEHLSRVGLRTVVAENGRIGVDLVKSRAIKQFNLILMDIHMPEMDGLEAAAKIREFDASIPIVAMTANVMAKDREIYLAAGMQDFVGKPFTSQDLWRCLMKYIKPVGMQPEDALQSRQADKKLRTQLMKSFLRNNEDIYEKIRHALKINDIKLAHRLAHTLKSNAGQLDKTQLHQAAKTVEDMLKNEKNLVSSRQLDILERELNKVLAEITRSIHDSDPVTQPEMMENTAARKLFLELNILLKESNFDSMLYVDDLKSIHGTETLVEQIENLDFKLALETLTRLIEQDRKGT